MRILYSCFLAFCVVLALSVPSSAAVKVIYVPCKTLPTDMELLEVGKVKDVLKSNSIQLENGSVFVLDNIRTPVYYEKMARDYLTDLVKGQTVGLYANKTLSLEGQADEHGNEKVHVVIEDGTWVQKAIVSAGLAWVDSSPSNRDCISELYKAEIPARAKKKGFWAAQEYKVKTPDTMLGGGIIGTFQVFEGLPKNIKGEPAWDLIGFYSTSNKRSMTIMLKHDDYILFPSYAEHPERHGFSVVDFANVRLRIRGWVEQMANGTPLIRLTHPEQLEFPDGPPVIK